MKRLAKYASLTLIFAAFLSAGSVSLVHANNSLDDINNLVQDATGVLNTVIVLLTAVCVVVFIVGLIRFVFHKGPEAKKEGRDYMIYSVIAFAVLTALFALANFLAGLVPGFETNNDLNSPQINANQ